MNFLFTILAISAILGAIAVVVSHSVVRMAFWLVVSLGCVAGLFFLADADFVGAAQLLVYVGGTLVLLVFGVMLTASGPYMKIETSPGETVVAGLIGCMFLFMVIATVSGVDWEQNKETLLATSEVTNTAFDDGSEGNTLRPLGFALLGIRPDNPGAPGYLLPFEIASVHLLVVLIGASYLARAKRRKDAA